MTTPSPEATATVVELHGDDYLTLRADVSYTDPHTSETRRLAEGLYALDAQDARRRATIKAKEAARELARATALRALAERAEEWAAEREADEAREARAERVTTLAMELREVSVVGEVNPASWENLNGRVRERYYRQARHLITKEEAPND